MLLEYRVGRNGRASLHLGASVSHRRNTSPPINLPHVYLVVFPYNLFLFSSLIIVFRKTAGETLAVLTNSHHLFWELCPTAVHDHTPKFEYVSDVFRQSGVCRRLDLAAMPILM